MERSPPASTCLMAGRTSTNIVTARSIRFISFMVKGLRPSRLGDYSPDSSHAGCPVRVCGGEVSAGGILRLLGLSGTQHDERTGPTATNREHLRFVWID